jgi:hypothetical protein
MKRFLSVLLCVSLVFGIIALSGCNVGNNSLSGTEIAKMLLANQRLNPSDLDLGLEAALTGAAKTKSAEALSAVKSCGPVLSLLSTSQSGSTVQWRDFTDESNTYSFFRSYFVNVEHTADTFSKEIAAIKETCGNTNYWMERPDTSEKFLLMVRANEDIIFIQNEDTLRVCRRYTNENADDVYDMYSKNLDGSYEERCLYIAGKRYEFANNFGAYEGIYIVAENTRGYWNMFQVTDIEPGRANVMNFVSNSSHAYTFDASIVPGIPEQIPAIRFSTADLTNDVLTFGNGCAELNISAFHGVDRIETDSSNVDFLDDGSNALTSQVGTLVTTSGKRISTYDTLAEGNVQVIGMVTSHIKNSYGPGLDSTTGCISLRLSGDTMEEQVANLKLFLAEAGLSCRYDLDAVLSAMSQATAYAEDFKTSYTWHGNSVSTYSGIEKAVATERAKYAEFTALYEQVKDMKTVKVDQFGASFDNWNFSGISSISGQSVTLADGIISVDNLSVTVADTTLFDSGSEYTVCLALAKFEDGGQNSYENAVVLSCEGADNTAFSGESFTLNQTATFTIPHCTYGQYTIVAYVATADGIRVTEMVPLIFTQDISQETTYEDITVTFATNSEKQLHITCGTPAAKPEEVTPTSAKKKTGANSMLV